MPVILDLSRPRLLAPARLRGQPRLPKSIRKFVPYARAAKETKTTVMEPDSEPLYLEPFVRAFLLGVSSGAALEAVHTAVKFISLGGISADSFAPLFAADHVTAFVGWASFYILDVLAIKAVLEAYKGDEQSAGQALSNLVTLPKRMLPLRLAVFKQFMNFSAAGIVASPPPPVANRMTTVPETATKSPTSLPLPKPQAPKATQNIVPTSPPVTRRRSIDNAEPTIIPGSIINPPSETPAQRLADIRARQGLLPGQMDPSTNAVLAARRKELADRRSYLYNFWYAAAASEQVKPGELHSVDILSQKLVLFRDSVTGEVRALDDVCPHRGAPFSAGWLEQKEGHDCVVCPYHGWAVDGEGRLRDVPAAEHKGEWPRRQVVPVYEVEERGGFIWLWYGSSTVPRDLRPPIPAANVPELEDPSWKAVYGEIEFDCGAFAVFENAIDMAHIHYLHSDSFGNQDKPEIRDMECTSDAFSVIAAFKLHNKPSSAIWEWTKVPEVLVTAKAFLPSTSMITFTLGNGLSFTTFVNTVPVGPNKTVNRFALVRNLGWDKTGAFNADMWDSWARRAMMKILGEDKVMVEVLRPDLLPKEFSVRADLPQVMFRKLRQQWVDLGYVRPSSPEDEQALNGAAASDGSFGKKPRVRDM